MSLQCYGKALEVRPEATYIYRLLGNVLTQQGRDEEARQCYAKALA